MKYFTHRLYFPAFLAALALVSTFVKANPSDAPLDTSKVIAAEKFAYGMYAIKESMKIRLAFENSAGSKVTVRITDAQGNVLHREELRNMTKMKRNYDLSSFGKGVYTVDITAGEFRTSNKVAVGGAQLTKAAFAAYISSEVKDGFVKVAFANAEEPVYIKIADRNGAVLYSEVSEGNQNYARRFKVSALQKGEYVLSISHGDKTLSQFYGIQ